jgi:hypothetical protein
MRAEVWLRGHPRAFGWGLMGVLLLVGYLHWHGWYQRGPNGIHEWAQADRLAIAMQYHARGMDFVRPRTLDVRPPDQVVGVELPLQAYLAASVGQVLGPAAISPAFRLLTALAMLLGLWAAVHLLAWLSGRPLAAAVLGLGLLHSPVWLAYGANYNPDPWALAWWMTAAWAAGHWYRSGRSGWWWAAVVSLAVAVACKLSLAPWAAAVALWLAWQWAQSRPRHAGRRATGWWAAWVWAGVWASLVLAWVVWQRHLAQQTDANLFLANIKPVRTTERFWAMWQAVTHDWADEYYPRTWRWYLVVWLALGGVGAWQLWHSMPQLGAGLRRSLGWAVGLGFVGGGVMTALMSGQLQNHDYYAISLFGPMLWVAAGVALWGWGRWQPGAQALAVGLAFIVTALNIAPVQYQLLLRQRDGYRWMQYRCYVWQDQAESLDSLGIGLDARLLVIDMPAPNLALYYLGRNGMVLMPRRDDSLTFYMEQNAQRYGLHWLVVPHDLQTLYADRPSVQVPLHWPMRLQTDRFTLYAIQLPPAHTPAH